MAKKILNISDFFKEQFTDFSTYAAYRSIASYTDGLKNSQRKVIYTTQRVMKDKQEKISRFASIVSLQTEYLHGEKSLEDAIVKIVRNWDQNLPLYEEKGKFGSRTIPKAASSRYIYTKRTNNFNKIFPEDFFPIERLQTFEGSDIEPKTLSPILPILLINGNSGVGSGFSQKILPRNPKDLMDTIQKFLKSKAKDPFGLVRKADLNVMYPNYIGKTFTTNENNVYQTTFLGEITQKNTTTLEIKELPIGYTIETYVKVLEDLIDNKVINSYKDGSSKNKFYFELKIKREQLKTKEFSFEEDENGISNILKTFKLIKTTVENFTTTDEENGFCEYNTPNEILESYLVFILNKFEELRQYKIGQINKEIDLLSEKARFIKLYIEKKIELANKSKKTIQTNMKKLKFSEDNIEVCLNMRIYSLTKEKYEELLEEIKKKVKVKEDLEKMTNKDLYLEYLNKIKIG